LLKANGRCDPVDILKQVFANLKSLILVLKLYSPLIEECSPHNASPQRDLIRILQITPDRNAPGN